jgi:phage terminase small subunit
MSQGNPTDKEIDVYSTAIVLDGVTQSDAWRKTFPKSKAKKETHHYKASLMNSMEMVQKRIKEKRLEQRKRDQEAFESGLDDQIMTKQKLARILTRQRMISMTDVADFKNVLIGADAKTDEPIYQTTWVIKNAEDIDPDIACMIKSVTATKSGPKIELHDATMAGKQLADLLGWNAPTKSELSNPDGTLTPTIIERRIIGINDNTSD